MAAEDRGGRPSQRAGQKERTRRLLRDAALVLFATHGYAATTVDDITSRVGASRATFYLHYDGKARVVAEIYESVIMAETFEFYHRLDRLLLAPESDLRGWLDEALGFFERHRLILGFADEAIAAEPALGELTTSQQLGRCTDCMPGFLDRWSGPDRELARFRVELLILQLAHFARLWVDGHWPVKRDVALDVLLGLWGHVLQPDQLT